MKKLLLPACCFLMAYDLACSAEIKGTLQQVVDGQTLVATGTVSVGIIAPGEGTRLDHTKAVGEAYAAQRIARLDSEGKFTLTNVPEGVPLYLSVFMRSGFGKFQTVTLATGQVLDVSQVVPDAKSGGVSCTGEITWPAGVVFREKAVRSFVLSGKNNNWVYIGGSRDSGRFKIENVQPGIYRLGVHSPLQNGQDRYDEVEVTVPANLDTPLQITIP
ncbi:hypothetical protein JIN84_05690 [Luteolibacter yonseiensis]|uniref:Carboxypeptidase regulatory-like domain-containing protein n=1 Tax=Luteolibacter yonseiensis TaxID=1144680 RepID=A0A934V9F8_9BACT|nr:hypothetical protein [Luteolibacter yonseiensis]MBK1815093.1 hypothetical protein [Luteolibacter yonseiensis]